MATEPTEPGPQVLARLELQDPENASSCLQRCIEIVKGKNTILFGRQSEKVDIVLNSEKYPRMMSRIHAKLDIVQDDYYVTPIWTLTDMNSLNGVLVNGRVISKELIKNNDIITFGSRGSHKVSESVPVMESDIVYKFVPTPVNLSGAKRRRDSADTSEQPSPKKPLVSSAVAPESTQSSTECILLLSDDEEDEKEKKDISAPAIVSPNVAVGNTPPAAVAAAAAAEVVANAPAIKDNSAELESFHQTIANMQKELDKARLENADLRKNTTLDDQFVAEFQCVICQDYFIDPYSLSCSHTFCSSCLRDWLKQRHECPMCRAPVTQSPIPQRILSGTTTKIVQKLPEDQQKEYEARQKKLTAQEEQVYLRLSTSIASARQQKMLFLNILNTWSPTDKKVFQDGVKAYVGRARQLYCSTTGLTPELVNKSSSAALTTMAKNVGIVHFTSPADCKTRLLYFISAPFVL